MTKFDTFISKLRSEYGFPEFEPGSPFYNELAEIREGVRLMGDEVMNNSGLRNEYQDWDDFWKHYEKLMAEAE